MARPTKSRNRKAPKYCHDKSSDRAFVKLQGRKTYLGQFGSKESMESYHRVIGEQTIIIPSDPDDITVTTLAIQYVKHAATYYVKNGKQTDEVGVARYMMKRLRQSYASLDPSDFGPLRFQALRQTFIDEGLARTTINHYMLHVLLMFKHAGRSEIVPMDLFRNLKAVGNLIEGRSAAKETADVMPVDDNILAETVAELKPTVADMVRLQLLTGMRPGEVRQLRPADIDRDGVIWKYTPPNHKNQHKKSRKAKIRIICIGPQAQDVLAPYLLRDHQTFCFSPCESQPNRGKDPMYSKDAYARAITRAALRANPYPNDVKGDRDKMKAWRLEYSWSPNQLRHNAATLARKVGGLETAQQVLGHTQSRTTENNYAEIDQQHAIEFAQNHG